MNLEQYNIKYHPGEYGSSHLTDPIGEFREVCMFGHVDSVNFLLFSPEAPPLPNIQEQVVKAMNIACRYSHFDLIKYVFSLEKSHNIILSEQILFNAIDNAARLGKIDVISFFFFPDESSNSSKIPIHKYGSNLLITAVRENQYEVVDFLLTHNKLKNHIDIHQQNDLAFKYAVKNNNEKLLEFFIFDMNIQITKDIEEFLLIDLPSIQVAKRMFAARDLNDVLEKELRSDRICKNKIKL
jgi:hypothetical protein